MLLTVFRKTKMRESTEVNRALQAMRACRTEHEPAPAHDTFTRTMQKGPNQ